jgi:hypothetical protein
MCTMARQCSLAAWALPDASAGCQLCSMCAVHACATVCTALSQAACPREGLCATLPVATTSQARALGGSGKACATAVAVAGD